MICKNITTKPLWLNSNFARGWFCLLKPKCFYEQKNLDNATANLLAFSVVQFLAFVGFFPFRITIFEGKKGRFRIVKNSYGRSADRQRRLLSRPINLIGNNVRPRSPAFAQFSFVGELRSFRYRLKNILIHTFPLD